jgi:hypothetical protein
VFNVPFQFLQIFIPYMNYSIFKYSAAYSAALLAVTLSVSPAHAFDGSHELESVVSDPKVLTQVLNSNTMRSARKLCLVVAKSALDAKKIDEKSFINLAAQCSVGNLNHVGYHLGADLHSDVATSQIAFPGGSTQILNAVEHQVINTANILKAPQK